MKLPLAQLHINTIPDLKAPNLKAPSPYRQTFRKLSEPKGPRLKGDRHAITRRGQSGSKFWPLAAANLRIALIME